MRRTLEHAFGFATSLAAYAAAAALFTQIHGTPSGVVLVALATEVPYNVVGYVLIRYVRRGIAPAMEHGRPYEGSRPCLLILGMLVLPIVLVPLAAHVVPGYSINGLFEYAVTIALVLGAAGLQGAVPQRAER